MEINKDSLIEFFTDEVGGLFATLEKLNHLILSKERVIESLSSKEQEMNESIVLLRKMEAKLSAAIEHKNLEIGEKNELVVAIAKMRKDRDDEIAKFNKEKEELSSEVKKLQSDYETWATKYKPSIEEMNARERLLDQREKDLEVIRLRFERKYAKIGQRFLVT